jgi:hypothetical protein
VEGKGWFSLLLAAELDATTVVPEYILRAVAFACADNVGNDTLKQAGLFRLRSDRLKELTSQFQLDAMRHLPSDEFVYQYRDGAPRDPLSLFVSYVEEYQAT